MATPDLPHLIEELNDAVDKNRKAAVKLDDSISAGNKILKRKTLFIIITLCSVILDITLTAWLAYSAVNLSDLQDAGDKRTDQISALTDSQRKNICNMDYLFNQSLQQVIENRGAGSLTAIQQQFIDISKGTRVDLNCPDSLIK